MSWTCHVALTADFRLIFRREENARITRILLLKWIWKNGRSDVVGSFGHDLFQQIANNILIVALWESVVLSGNVLM
jgi:hypothetical protein